MSEVIIIGLDIAKHVFHAHGADERGSSDIQQADQPRKAAGFLRSAAELHGSAGGMWRSASLGPSSSPSLAMKFG